MKKSVLVLLSLAAPLPAAPAPPPRVPEIRPGCWVLRWGGYPDGVGYLVLGRDGSWFWRTETVISRGTYRWDSARRTLHVREVVNGSAATSWHAVLDRDLKGVARGPAGIETDIHIYKERR